MSAGHKSQSEDQVASQPRQFASVFPTPKMPPLSSSQPQASRRSQSYTYNNRMPEWFYKPTPTLPNLWIRDGRWLTAEIAAEWDRSWRRYGILGYEGKGDGAGMAAKTRHGRRKIETEYRRLDRETRKAKEVALARYAPFCLRATDGTLDYFTDGKPKEEGAGCVMM